MRVEILEQKRVSGPLSEGHGRDLEPRRRVDPLGKGPPFPRSLRRVHFYV